MTDFLSKLNDEQIKPVMETEGAVLVFAGAGSGKTRVLTGRIAHLVRDLGVDPYNILAITFTNKAANEMKERLERLIGDVGNMWVCTIHSMCVKILRSDADKIGYQRNFSIYSDTDKDKVLKRVITSLSLEPDKYLKSVKNYLSTIKSKDLSIEEFETEYKRVRNVRDYVRIIEGYEDELKKSNAFDFDDLLIKTYRLLAGHREVLEKFSSRFRYIHIDEFQDTNTVQCNIVKLLSFVHGNIFAVGDDDQSIYGWRGADVNNILGFNKSYKDAKIFKLERNYRSTKKILDLANTIIAGNVNRSDKVLWTDNEEGVRPEVYVGEEESEEAQYTAVKIKTLLEKGYKYSDFAVLMRINALSRSYEQEFMKYGIPCRVYGGFKFFERKEIKDLTAYLRILNNPLDNEAILRIINVPKRGIGEKSVETIINYSASRGFSVFDGVYDCENLDMSAAAKQKIRAFRDLLDDLCDDKENMKLGEFVREVIKKTDYLSCFEERTDENEDKKRNVDELINSVDEFEKQNPNASLSEYLNSITLSSDTDDINDGNVVTLATIHSVKGLEFKCVFICGLDKEIFPIERSGDDGTDEEEERRLMYVAITRAMERLYFTRAKSRFLYGSRRPTAQSEYLDDLAEKLGIQNARRGYYNSYRTENFGFERERNTYYGSGGYSAEEGGYSSSVSGSLKKGAFLGGFSNVMTKKNERPKDKNLSEFGVGVKVLHKKFGEGVIITMSRNGDDVKADVAFKGIGIKSLLLGIAPIEVIK